MLRIGSCPRGPPWFWPFYLHRNRGCRNSSFLLGPRMVLGGDEPMGAVHSSRKVSGVCGSQGHFCRRRFEGKFRTSEAGGSPKDTPSVANHSPSQRSRFLAQQSPVVTFCLLLS